MFSLAGWQPEWLKGRWGDTLVGVDFPSLSYLLPPGSQRGGNQNRLLANIGESRFENRLFGKPDSTFCGRRPLPFGGSHLRLPIGPAGIRTTTGSCQLAGKPTPYQLSHRVAFGKPDSTFEYFALQYHPRSCCDSIYPARLILAEFCSGNDILDPSQGKRGRPKRICPCLLHVHMHGSGR